MDVTLNVAASHVISSHISRLCHDAATMTFARSADLRLLAQSNISTAIDYLLSVIARTSVWH